MSKINASDRFLKFVRKTNGCWLWVGGLSSWGYGKFWFGRTVAAHRWAYEHYVGLIPKGLGVLHTCDNPLCVKPEHLFVGTHQTNMKDMTAKGRHADFRGVLHGQAKLSSKDVIEIRRLVDAGYQKRVLAKRYGVSDVTIGLIARRTTWRHI